MHSLNVIGVVVPPGDAHAAGTDVVGDEIAVVSELLFANAADSVLSPNLAVEQLAHSQVRAQLSVSPWVLKIVDAVDADLVFSVLSGDALPATAEAGVMNGADLGATEAHLGSSSWFALMQPVVRTFANLRTCCGP